MNYLFDKKKSEPEVISDTKRDPNDKGHEINEKEETIFDIYMLIIGYVIIISFGIWFHYYFKKIMYVNVFYISVFFVIIFPLLMFSYYIFYEIYNVREHLSYEKILAETKYEIEREEKISTVIPVILFGVGIVYSNIQKKSKVKTDLLQISSPYLLFALLFGTVFPNIISYLVFDNNNLDRLMAATDLNFVSVSISFGLMMVSLIVPFFTHYKDVK
jgi:hypothetical protein